MRAEDGGDCSLNQAWGLVRDALRAEVDYNAKHMGKWAHAKVAQPTNAQLNRVKEDWRKSGEVAKRVQAKRLRSQASART